MDSKRKAKDDSKGLDRLFKITVLGSALIVLVYSIYYYSNAYKHSKTNIYRAAEQADILVAGMETTKVVAAENIIFTNNQNAALQNGTKGWLVKGQVNTAKGFEINSRTTVAMSGVVSEGFDALITDELIKRFSNIPPIMMDKELQGVVVKSIQFEHFAFPYHAMIDWRNDTKTHKTFSFIVDSMPGNFESFEKGFAWFSTMYNEYIQVHMCNIGDSIGPKISANLSAKEQNRRGFKMPIIDFDLLFEQPEQLGLNFENKGNIMPVVESEGEIKLLIGPSLKQGNAYQIENTDEDFLEIKPPFWVSLSKEKGAKPYFFALITNEKLLLQ